MSKAKAYHHGNLRAALVAAGIAAITEHGPDGFTLRDVARRAGVSPAAPYRHFRDKHELFAAIAADCVARINAATDAALVDAPAEPLARFRIAGIAYVRFAAAHPAHFRALSTPGVIAHAPADVVESHATRTAAELAALRAGQVGGTIAPLPLDDLVLAARAIVHGLAHMIVTGELGDVDDARAEALAKTVTYALGIGLYPRLADDPLASGKVNAKPNAKSKPRARPRKSRA